MCLLKKSAFFLTRSKLASMEDIVLDDTLFRVYDGLSDSAFLSLFLDLLKNISTEDYLKIKKNIRILISDYGVNNLQELLDLEPSLISTLYDQTLDLINKHSPDSYMFDVKGDGRYGFWKY